MQTNILHQFINSTVTVDLMDASVTGKLVAVDSLGVLIQKPDGYSGAGPARKGTTFYPWLAFKDIHLTDDVVPIRQVA